MTRRIIPAAALLALAACAASPTTPASARISRDGNPGIGSGAGVFPPPDANSGQLGSGALFDASPGIGAGVGIAAPADANTGQLGSGNAPEGPVIGSGS
ncbi:hypothetical protein [Longimicrobium sp.]|uniref:hypothetical protein n=1 Tax=Longimicrobium sp. TaxID=2029185 RepID=UPI002BD81E2C|nr:hypothetical protein [Longimicrobium sp.]HSU16693.1 hypothetical protein [Longimicrobium sp.]